MSNYFEWDDVSASFEASADGHLTCQECGELWCEHTQFAMVRNLDAEFVWDNEGVEEWHVQVPMFPTQKLWAESALVRIEGMPYVELHLVTEDDLIKISYLHPGEGRNVIRTIFIDHMLTRRVVDAKLICGSPSHKFRQETAWQQRTRSDNKNRVAEYWSVWTTGACINCRGLSVAGFDPDLVPDKEGSIW